MNAPLVPVTVAFLLGVLLGHATSPHPAGPLAAGLLAGGAAWWGRRRAKTKVLALLLLWGCLGALRMIVWEEHPDAQLKKILSEEPQPVQLHGVVVDDPVELFEPGEAYSTEETEVSPNPDRQVCMLELLHVRMGVPAVPGTGGTGIGTEAHWQPIAGRVRTTIHASKEPLRYGDEILVEGQWSRVPSPGNPGQYDWRASLARKRIHGLLRVRPFDGVVVLQRGKGNPLLAAVFRLRERWVRLIQAHFDPRDAGLLLALLLGERTEIDEELKQAFVHTGTVQSLATQSTKLYRDSPASHVTI